MAYKFQRGSFTASGSITVEEELTGSGNVLLGQLANSSSIRGVLDLEDADGATYGLKLGSTLVTATATELNYLDITAAGGGEASKALVLDSSRDIDNILNLTASYVSASYFYGDGSNLTGIDSGGGSGSALTRGYLWVGDGANTAMAFDAASSAQILLGDGTDLLSVAISGDATLSSAGAISIGNNKLIQRMFGTGSANANVYQTGSVVANHIKQAAVTMAAMATGSVENNAYATGSIEVNHIKQAAVTMAAMATGSVENNAYATGSIEVNHIKQGAVTMAAMATGSVENNAYATGSVENAHLAGGITGAKMNNAIFADLEIGAPSADGEVIVATGAGAFQYESGATLRTSIGVGTGDSPQFTGLTVTGFVQLSGNIDIGTGDDIINIGASGGDTLNLRAQADFQNGATWNMQSISANDTLAAGDYYNICSGSSAITVTLPDVSSATDGTLFHIKRGANMSSNVTIITGSGDNGESIDDDNSIALESPLAAVSVLWDSNNNIWHVF